MAVVSSLVGVDQAFTYRNTLGTQMKQKKMQTRLKKPPVAGRTYARPPNSPPGKKEHDPTKEVSTPVKQLKRGRSSVQEEGLPSASMGSEKKWPCS